MATNGILTRKLAYLQEQLSVLRSWRLGSLKEYSENQLLQRAVERQLQVCVEIVIDICERILAARKLPPADTSADNLHEVAKLGLIARVEDYTDMIRFRNFLVHRYESVETEIVYDIVKNKLDTLDRFLSEISAATEN